MAAFWWEIGTAALGPPFFVVGLVRYQKKDSPMKMIIMALAFVAVAAGLSACNTVSGVGRDITTSAETVRGWF